MSTTRMRLGALVTAGVLGLGLSACGDDDSAQETTTEATTPADTGVETTEDAADTAIETGQSTEPPEAEGEEIPIEEFLAMLQEPGEETLSRYSLTMEMDMEGQTMDADGSVDLSGDSPAVQMVMNIAGMGSMEMIMIDGATYIAMPGLTPEGTYMEAPPELLGETAPLEDIDVSEQWDTWEEGARQVLFLGEEDVDGTDMRRYEITVDVDMAEAAEAAGVTAEPGTEDTVQTMVYDVWLDDDNLMRQMEMEIEGSTMRMTMDNWGEEQDINAPDPDQITDMGEVGGTPTG